MIKTPRTILLICITITLFSAQLSEAAKISVDIGYCEFNYLVRTNKVLVIPGLLGMIPLEPKQAWESQPVSDTVFHVRLPGIKDSFLKVDTVAKKIYAVSGGALGKDGGTERAIVNAYIKQPPPFMPPIPGVVQVQLVGASLKYDSDTKDIAIICERSKIMGKDDIEIIELENDIYHLRLRAGRDPKVKVDHFLKIDTKRKMLQVVNGTFGEHGGREVTIMATVSVDDPRAVALPASNIHDDLGMAGVKKDALRESPWFAADKELFQEVLKAGRFDMLIVPVQVQDNAFDHIERMLMTRLLVRAVQMASGRSIPDPDLVERALVWGSRTYTEQSVYKLANMLNVRTLVRVYAGHGRDMKMRITVVQQERPEAGSFDSVDVNRKEIVFPDIPFSDERLPSDALSEKLPAVLTALGVFADRDSPVSESTALKKQPIPASPLEAVKSKDSSPLLQAAYLAILGAFSPPDSLACESFFERSLSLLRAAPQQAADQRFLRSYALANLYRRPAALEAMGKPSTPELTALRSYLNGDLSDLSVDVEKIKTPIPRLLMQIALSDLLWKYDPQTARTRVQTAIKELPAGWTLFNERRLTRADAWKVPPTIDLKKYLDDVFPVKGYALQDIFRGMAVRGDLSSGELISIDTSVHIHRKRVLTEQPSEAVSNADGSPSRADLLDLSAAWAEAGILKSVNLRVYTQGLYEDGIALVDKYETFFRGHPKLASYKASGLWSLSRQKQGDERRNMERMSGEINRDVCTWSGGQTLTSYYACTTSMVYFENDFPRRPFWGVPRDHSLYGDRAEYQLREVVVTSPASTVKFFADTNRSTLKHRELAFRYELWDAQTLEWYHGALISANMLPEADMLLDRSKQRFAGSPRKAEFMAKQLEKKGNDKAVIRLYEETIRAVPGVWAPYFELGSRHLGRGDSKKAGDVFRQYPFFPMAGTPERSDAVDTVVLSNNAYEAGKALHWAGETKEAKAFFELSTRYDTGSGRCMRSAYHLALYAKDYEKAAQTALTLGRRYGHKDAYGDYLHILRVVSQAPETDALFVSLNLLDSDVVPWAPVIAGLRMEAKSDDDMRAWLAAKGKNSVGRTQARRFYVTAFLEDRKASPELSDMIENIERHVELPERQRTPSRTMDRDGKNVLSVPALYASVRYAIEQKQYEQAITLLYQWTRVFRAPEESKSPFLEPYVTWANMKVGERSNAEQLLNVSRSRRGANFEYWLGRAMLDAGAGKHEDALRSLDLARFNINSTLNDTRPIGAWYQLVEACELLFEDTGNIGYWDKAIELSRIRQQMFPLTSWAYAVEAKYAKTSEECLRPLAITLYLDPRSFHIADIPEAEKEKARKWLETDNPFRVAKPSHKRQAAVPAPERSLFATNM